VVADLEALTSGGAPPAGAPEASGYAAGVGADSLNLTQA
jgi:hypothetical protein